MNKYFSNNLISEEHKVIIYPNNTISEYVPFYSILYSNPLMNTDDFMEKTGMKPAYERFGKNPFLEELLLYGTYRMTQMDNHKQLFESKEFTPWIDATIKTALIPYLRKETNFEIGFKDKPSGILIQNNVLLSLTGNTFKGSSDYVYGPLFLADKSRVHFSCVIKRSNIIKAKADFIKTGVWNIKYLELWITKNFLKNPLIKVESFLTQMIEETKIETKIIDDFKCIFSPTYVEFKSIKERKEYLAKFEQEIKDNIKAEVSKIFDINQVEQEKAVKKLESQGIYVLENQKTVEKPKIKEPVLALEALKEMVDEIDLNDPDLVHTVDDDEPW